MSLLKLVIARRSRGNLTKGRDPHVASLLGMTFGYYPFATAKVRREIAPHQIFGPRIFPQGGGNSLIVNGLKNAFLRFFHSADNQRVTATENNHLGNNTQHTIYQRVKDTTLSYYSRINRGKE